MKVAIAGGSGLIGHALGSALRARGDDVRVLTRRIARAPWETQWDPVRGASRMRSIEGFDAVVNLCGAPLATRPWTSVRRRVLLDSRVLATETLLACLSRLDAPPPVFVGVATLGRFGDRGQDDVGDDDPPGEGFLADLGVAWERAHLAATQQIGARSVVCRYGVVFSEHGGALPLLIQPFLHGFGGWLGDGRQYLPWVSMADTVGTLLHAIDSSALSGCVNVATPEPPTNRALCEAVGRALGRSVTHHAPRWVVRGAWGDLADALVLASIRARTHRLDASGYRFSEPDIDAYLARVIPRLV